MQVREIMTKGAKYIPPSMSLKDAAALMLKEDIGALLVGEDDRLVGVVTDRDIAIRGIAKGKDPQSTHVDQVMTPKCLYCFENDSVEEVSENMAQNQIRRLPVLNQDKRLVGIVSLGDLCTKGSKECAADALSKISEKSH